MITNLVKVNDIEMEYFSFGSGERAFVILPGVSTKSILQSAKAVQAAYKLYEEEYTVYVFDRRKNMPSCYPVRQMAADTAAVMRHIGISSADIFGASQGGMMALCIAIDAPQLVHRLVLGSTTCATDTTVKSVTDRWVALACSKDRTALTAELIECMYSENTIKQYKDVLLHMNDDMSDDDIERFVIQTKAIDDFDVYGELDKISCPTLVIGAEGDKLLPPQHSRRIAKKLGCELYLYGAEYGHCVYDEATDYGQRIFNFFQKA